VGHLAACRAEGKRGSRAKGNATAVDRAGLLESRRSHSMSWTGWDLSRAQTHTSLAEQRQGQQGRDLREGCWRRAVW